MEEIPDDTKITHHEKPRVRCVDVGSTHSKVCIFELILPDRRGEKVVRKISKEEMQHLFTNKLRQHQTKLKQCQTKIDKLTTYKEKLQKKCLRLTDAISDLSQTDIVIK